MDQHAATILITAPLGVLGAAVGVCGRFVHEHGGDDLRLEFGGQRNTVTLAARDDMTQREVGMKADDRLVFWGVFLFFLSLLTGNLWPSREPAAHVRPGRLKEV